MKRFVLALGNHFGSRELGLCFAPSGRVTILRPNEAKRWLGANGMMPPFRLRLIAVAARSGDMAWALSSLADNASSPPRPKLNPQ